VSKRDQADPVATVERGARQRRGGLDGVVELAAPVRPRAHGAGDVDEELVGDDDLALELAHHELRRRARSPSRRSS
jgi:hypothetical protein